MNKITKQNYYTALAAIAMLAAAGCGKHTNTVVVATNPVPTVAKPRTVYIYNTNVVIIYSGCPNGWGACYYYGNNYSYWDYNAWYYNTDPGIYGYYGYTSSGSSGSSGSYSSGTSSTGSSSTGSSSTGSSSTGSSSTGSSSTGSSSTGSSSTGSGSAFTIGDFVNSTDAIELPILNGAGSTAAANGFADSVGGDTKDVDLQRSDFQQQGLNDRAQAFASQFQMDFDKAIVLTQLADKVQALTLRNEMTAQQRETIVDGALSTAGIKSDEVNSAIAQIGQHADQTAMNNLMEKAAKNLGMPSSAGLRDQLLPALGIQF